MKRNFFTFLSILCLMYGVSSSLLASDANHYPLSKVQNDLSDKASLQKGAKIYMNYCLGCHSLQYTRYIQLGEYLGVVDENGEVYDKIIQSTLNFVSDKVTDKVTNSIPQKDAEKWFGVAPPDLTLVTRTRGKDWVYSYLKSFYVDENRPWGVNNAVFPDVGMPHVLLPEQGKQRAITKKVSYKVNGETFEQDVIEKLELIEPGDSSEAEFDKNVTDLVNFLEYIGEPVKEKRQRVGVFVLLFLIILTAFLYALKREFWKDIH